MDFPKQQTTLNLNSDFDSVNRSEEIETDQAKNKDQQQKRRLAQETKEKLTECKLEVDSFQQRGKAVQAKQ